MKVNKMYVRDENGQIKETKVIHGKDAFDQYESVGGMLDKEKFYKKLSKLADTDDIEDAKEELEDKIAQQSEEIAKVKNGKIAFSDLDGESVYVGEDNKVHAKSSETSDYAKGLIYTKETISDYKEIPITWNVGSYINSVTPSSNFANETSGSGMGYAFLDVEEGDKIRISGINYYYMGLWVMYKGDVAVQGSLNASAGNNSQTSVEEITIPSEITKIAVNTRSVALKENITVVEKFVNGETKTVKINSENVLQSGNVLYGKKWVACGDSFTEGDFTNYVDEFGQTARDSDAFDKEYGHYKTYPYWIKNRNDMNIQWLAKAGSDFTNVSGSTNPFSDTNTQSHNYTLIDKDADYITIMFGLNESTFTDEEIGVKTDTTNATLWGAYNIVFEWILTNCPYAKLGVIVSDAWLSQKYHDALISICEWWGVPYLDLRNDKSVPMGINGRLDSCSGTAKMLRDNAFRVSAEDSHPNVKAHEYRSTVIENFLRSL